MGYLKHQLHWSKAAWYCLQGWVTEESLAEALFLNRLDTELSGLGQQHRRLLLDAAAIAAYHAEVAFFFIIQSSKQIIELLNFIGVRFAFDQSFSYRNSYTSLAFPKMDAK